MNQEYIKNIPFIGVVEDRMDPIKLNRYRVRCFHVHPEDKTLVPTEQLPWAFASQLRLKEGDHVKGYFEDGDDMQMPVITEKIIGIPEKSNKPTLGFNDPRTEDQRKAAPRPPQELKDPEDGTGVQIVEQAAALAGYRLNEPICNRLLRGENLDDYTAMLENEFSNLTDYPLGLDSMLTGVVNSVLISAQQQVTGAIATLINKIPGAALFTPTIIRNFFTQPYFKKYTLSSTYSFPKSSAAPQYPYNNAKISESGHIREVDDTPGAERIHTRHRAGTFEEYRPDGDYAHRTRKDKHVLVDGCDTTIIKGKKQVVVEGSESVTIRGARYIQIEGKSQIVVIGDADISVQGNSKQYIKGNFEQVVGGNFSQTILGNHEVSVTGTSKYSYTGDMEQYYYKDLKQEFDEGEWTLKTNVKALRWQFRGSPITNKPINLSQVVLVPLDPYQGNSTAFDGDEFSLSPTIQSAALIKVGAAAEAGTLDSIDVANVGFVIAKTVANDGFSVV